MKHYVKKGMGIALSIGVSSVALASHSVSIANLQAFTGPIESLVVNMSLSAELAATEASESGKFHEGATINVVRGDSMCIDADAATAEAERLINSENVIGIMGPNCSGVTTAVVNNVTAPLGVVNISPSATSPALSTIEDNGFFFRTAPSDARQGEVLATIAMHKGISQVAVTHGNDDYGKGLADAFIASYTALGGEVTASAAHEANKADYSADVAALSAAGSSTLAVFGYVEGGGTSVVTAALDTGAFDNFIFADGMIGDTLTNAGGALLNGSWGTMPGGGGAAADKWTAVGEAGGVAMGGPFLGESYDAMALIILAAQAADSTDRAAIQAQVMNVANAPGEKIYAGELGKALSLLATGTDIDYVGATGVEFNDVGEVKGSYEQKEIIDGSFTTVATHQ
ncbi:MAG: ABC transporter substrate-binding protein [PS1 clade bacterium]|jgi:branched-chain amino acid transport system substrate-binding protein